MDKHKKVLIVAITRMGDLLQASPTLVGLKKLYPGAEISIIADKQFASICEGISAIDEVISVDMNFLARAIWNGGPALVDGYTFLDELVEDMKSREFDICLNMSNSNYTAVFISLLNIPQCNGWFADEKGFRMLLDPWAILFTASIYHSNRLYNSFNLVDFFRSAANVNEHPHHLTYSTTTASDESMKDFINSNFPANKGPLIAIQAGASQEKRQWGARRFALLARYLIEDQNARIVFTGAPDEQHIIDEILKEYNHVNIVSAIGHTNIPQLASLLKSSDLLITGDTGPMHMAVAVGTPVVALFLASALGYETGPYSAGNIVVQPQISCYPCNPNYPCARPDCHGQISPELIAHLAKLRLTKDVSEDMFLQVPPDIAPDSQVRVFLSEFDSDGYINLRLINGTENSEKDAARRAYRKLWKEEFGVIPRKKSNATQINKCGNSDLDMTFEKVLEIINKAIKSLQTLVKVAADNTQPVHILGDISRQLSEVEQDLEQISLTFPILGTVIRIFIIEKENIRGEDIFLLSAESEERFHVLKSRVIRLMNFYVEELGSQCRSNYIAKVQKEAFQPTYLEENVKELGRC